MFENLLSFWRGKDFLSTVLDEFKDMLDDTQLMFQSVCARLIENSDDHDLKQKIYDVDKRINLLEKEIRRRIVEHLALQPTVDVTACLLLMSVVKDAERLGDYAKNLYEVTELLDKPIDRDVFSQYFGDLHGEVLTLFEQTKEAFIEADADVASSAWPRERKIARRCDEILERLARSSLSVNEAVCLALTARYFKRTMAHLVNIATSVILPLSEIDYFDERREDD